MLQCEVTGVPADRYHSLLAVLSSLSCQVGFFAARSLIADCSEQGYTAQVLCLLDVLFQTYESLLLFSAKNTEQRYHLQQHVFSMLMTCSACESGSEMQGKLKHGSLEGE